MMKTMLKPLFGAAILGATLSGCAVYAPPVDVGVGVAVGPRYRYAPPPPVVVVPRYDGYGYYGRGYYGRGYPRW